MSDHPDLATLLADPASLSVDQIPAAIGELERVKAVLWAQLLAARCDGAVHTDLARYVTQAEAAAQAGISLADVRFLTRRGLVPALGRGKNKRLRLVDLHTHLDRCRERGLAVRGIPDVSSRRDRRGGSAGAGPARPDAKAIR